jgi:hypothetical protein
LAATARCAASNGRRIRFLRLDLGTQETGEGETRADIRRDVIARKLIPHEEPSMSTTKPRKKKATAKTSGSKNAGVKKKAATKAVSKKSMAAKTAGGKSAAKKTIAKKAVAKKTASKATKPVAKPISPSKPKKATSAARTTNRSSAKPEASRKTAKRPSSRPSRAGNGNGNASTATRGGTSGSRLVTPKVAARHFREALQAKQERVRQGPNYPPANAFTGRNAPLGAALSGGLDPHAPLPATGTPAPEALTGANSLHGRGNQGMRKQK